MSSQVIFGNPNGNVSHMRGARPAYPGFLTQGYRVGDHLYSTGGSEAQRPPSTMTVRVQPYQWLTEHKREVSFSLAGQGLAATDRAASFLTNSNALKAATKAHERSTQMIANKMAATSKLKAELEAGSSAVAAELALLQQCMAATQAQIDSKRAPLEAVDTFYTSRQTERVPTERLCDPVKHDLEVMTATLKESVRLLESALSAQQSEAMRLQIKKDVIDADAADKATGLAIDTAAKEVSKATMGDRPFTAPPPMSPFTKSFPGMTMHRVGMFKLHAPYDPVMWQSSTKAIADEGRKVVAISKRLRDTSMQLIKKRQAAELEVYTDLVRDYQSSIANIKLVMQQTQDQVDACETEMGAIDSEVSACEQAYGEKQDAIAVAAERLSQRSMRPARELVQDPAQRALANELAELKSSSRLIEGAASKLLNDKARLMSMVDVLQDTLNLKQSSLQVEEGGEPTMKVLDELCAGSVAELPPTAAFHSSFARPITALPAHRLSLSRVYATK